MKELKFFLCKNKIQNVTSFHLIFWYAVFIRNIGKRVETKFKIPIKSLYKFKKKKVFFRKFSIPILIFFQNSKCNSLVFIIFFPIYSFSKFNLSNFNLSQSINFFFHWKFLNLLQILLKISHFLIFFFYTYLRDSWTLWNFIPWTISIAIIEYSNIS